MSTSSRSERNSGGKSESIPSAAVQTELKKILASDTMSGSARMCRFLTFVVQATLHGEASNLNQYLLGVEVFDKPPSFDPNIDPIVRVEAGRLRQKLNAYYSTEGRGDPIIIALAPRGYQAAFHFRSEVPEAQAGPETALPAAAASSGGQPAIAVLPFDDLTPARDEEGLCDGLAAELVMALTRVPGIRVVSMKSCMQFKAKADDIREIGRHLNAAAVIEGNVRKHDGLYRIAAQLNNVADGFVLWAGAYNWDGQSVFTLQGTLSEAVVRALHNMLQDSSLG